jgi:hypothetical protein
MAEACEGEVVIYNFSYGFNIDVTLKHPPPRT